MNEMLESILVANRGEPSKWIHAFLLPKIQEMGYGCIVDKENNVYIPPLDGSKTKVLFVAHTDTVDTPSLGDRKLETAGEIVALAPDQPNRCLGADDGAGVYILLRLLEAKVEGGYLFTTGEERGGIGVNFFIQHNSDTLRKFDMCLEFDRYGYQEIITEQSPGTCASDTFALSLARLLNATEESFDYYPSPEGLYTDNADLSEFIPECVNVSVGYYGHHTNNEWLDFGHVERLINALLVLSEVDAFSSLPIDREAGDWGDDYPLSPAWAENLIAPVQEVKTVQDFVTEYPAVVTEFLENIGVDLWELDDFANKAGYVLEEVQGRMDEKDWYLDSNEGYMPY